MALIVPARSPDTTPTNEQVQYLIGHRVAQVILDVTDDTSLIEIGPLSSNNFSFTFSVKADTPVGSRNVFVKIPKVDMRGKIPAILPITLDDQKMWRDEEASLKLLAQKWEGNQQEAHWVKLLGIIPEYNAIITDRIYADEAFVVFRRFDLRRRLGFNQDAQRLKGSMARLGAALGGFHQIDAHTSAFRLSEAMPKFEFYCKELSSNTSSVWPQRVLIKLRSTENFEIQGIAVPTLKGIDIRNILIDEQDTLYLLDPGKTKITYREADLARFIMTYRILYWGSKLLLLFREPDSRAETAFLESYYSSSPPPCPQLLNIFLLKEQLKHWHTALDSLQQRPWSPLLKRLVAKIYVNPFYIRQIAAQLKLIAK